MPIHDQGYRRYAGARTSAGRRWAIIASAGIRMMLRKKAFVGLLVLGGLPFVMRTVQIYLATTVEQWKAFLQVTPEIFKEFLVGQGLFVFFITVYAGAGLIANDRRANALQLYLSKPLTRVEYVFGKLATLMAFLLLVTFVPGMLLILLQVLFAGNLTFLRANLHVIPATMMFAFLQALASSMTMLALSSLSKSSRFVGILYAVVMFLTHAVYGILRVVTGGTKLAWVSFSANLDQIAARVFGLPLPYDMSWLVSVGIVIGVVVVSGVVLERRVRAVEIVT